MVDRTPKYFFFLYVLVTTNVNSAVDHCIPFSVSKNAFLSKVAGVTNRGTFFFGRPCCSATYFDVEEHHCGMFGVFNKMLEKHCERNKCRAAHPRVIMIFCNLFK